MLHHISRLIEPLLRLLWPAAGRHRLSGTPLIPAPLPAARRLLAHDQREKALLQRSRCRALWLAVHGVDVGPRSIHGVEVAA
ncbi:hypothetical protein ACFVXC_23420 [Streptomyces sp. NPDC058257]|uniref:hypothetical protein n=1 Tax=Streptomyces sp. NPDC058257 TaxID=3346409 RepID=UPI0036EC0801